MLSIDRTEDGALVFGLRVSAGSSRDKVMGLYGERLKVSVTAPPEDGKANKAVCELLGDHLGVPTSYMAIVTGKSRPDKKVAVYGVEEEDLQQLARNAE